MPVTVILVGYSFYCPCVFFCRLWNTAYVDVNIQPSPEDLRAAIQFSGCPDRLQ